MMKALVNISYNCGSKSGGRAPRGQLGFNYISFCFAFEGIDLSDCSPIDKKGRGTKLHWNHSLKVRNQNVPNQQGAVSAD